MPEALLTATSPVFTVASQVHGDLARDLLRLDVEHDITGLKTLRAHFLAAGGTADPASGSIDYVDGAVLDFGKQLSVSIGPPGDERIVFSGTISALEAGFAEGQAPDVAVFAEDALMKLRMTQRCKSYERMTDADIASSIATAHGMVADVAADGPTYDVVRQLDQSDLAFLRERARLIQAELWADGATLCFKTRPNRTATKLTLVQGNELLSVRLRADVAHQRSKVTVTGYDAAQRAAIEQSAGPEVLQAEIQGGRTGITVLGNALGELPVQYARQAPLTGTEATAWAKAEMLRRSRGFVGVTGTTRGTADLVVGSLVTLERVGAPFEGDPYYVTTVHHSYDLRNGHRTHFTAERATLAGAA
jgi:Bacteriophage probable baseplate hub protein